MLICRVFALFIVVLYGSACFARSPRFNSTCVSKVDDMENGDSDLDENDNEEENSGSGSIEYSLKRTTDATEIVNELDGHVKSIEKTISEIKVDDLKKFFGGDNIMEGIRNAGENLKEEFRKSKDDYNVLMKDVMHVKYINTKLESRTTPGNQQWGGRLVSAVGVFDSNLGRLKTAAENGDAVGVFSAISSMAGGILSVFPSAPAVFGGAFFQLLSTFISFGGSFDKQGDSLVIERIKTAVLELKTDHDKRFLAVMEGAHDEILVYYEAFAPLTERFSRDTWDLWGATDDLPSHRIGASQLTQIKTWVDYRISKGLYDNIYEMIAAYVSIASIVDKVFFKNLELMPLGRDPGYCKKWGATNKAWNTRRRNNLEFLITHLVPDYQKILYLQTYFPPGNDGISSEIYEYARSLSYKLGRGETKTMFIMDDPPVVDDGEYWLESVAHTGYYMTLAEADWKADWNQYVKVKKFNDYCSEEDKQNAGKRKRRTIDTNATRRGYGGGGTATCKSEMKDYKIGGLVTLTKKDMYGGPSWGTYINIRSHTNPLHKTLTFRSNGIARFVIDSEDSDVHLETAQLYATSDVHKNELPSWSKLTTSYQFKVIPLTESKPGEPMRVVIGMVTGDRKHFLRTGAWSSVWHGAHMPIYMKTLTQNGITSGEKQYRVDNSFRWLLHPTKK